MKATSQGKNLVLRTTILDNIQGIIGLEEVNFK